MQENECLNSLIYLREMTVSELVPQFRTESTAFKNLGGQKTQNELSRLLLISFLGEINVLKIHLNREASLKITGTRTIKDTIRTIVSAANTMKEWND